MRRIVITSIERAFAIKFRDRLKNGNAKNYKKPIDNLTDLAKTLKDKAHIAYVQKIITEWDDLIVLEPKDFTNKIKEFETILKMRGASGEYVKVGKKTLHSLITQAMRYNYVQKSVYPEHMKNLGIKTCVYCNAQYAFAVDTYINYELDHWKSKSDYPFLSTSIFNLQPSCSKCNRYKSKKESLFNLFTDGTDVIVPFIFALKNNYIRYFIDHDASKLNILFLSNDAKLRANHDELFHIENSYKAHIDVVEQFLWKYMTRNSTIREIYKDVFKKLGFKEADFNRFILGNYCDDSKLHLRPLSKLSADIARQLKLIP